MTVNGRAAPRAGIIGAGASGLTAARHLLARGFSVEIFERSAQIGGVWAPWRAYPGLHTQTPRDQFAFSDHAMPRDLPDWPAAASVQAHLNAYADRFDIRSRVHLETEVLQVSPLAGDRWSLRVRQRGIERAESCDYVVVASGLFDRPRKPDLPRLADFEAAGGRVVHSLHCLDPALLQGRKVVVLGFQKTAMDLAAHAAAQGSQVDLIYRQARWKLPRHLAGRINVRELFYSRLAEILGRPTASLAEAGVLQKLRHRLGRPLTQLMHKALQGLLRRQLHLDRLDLLPQQGFAQQVHCGVSLAPPGFFERVEAGGIHCRRGRIAGLEAGAVRLDDGRCLSADVLILATGFDAPLAFLAPELRKQICDDEGLLRLYRNILPPPLPTLGFCGFNSSFASPITAEVGAVWLGEVWSGAVALPDADAMRGHAQRELSWRLRHWPEETRALRNACVGANLHHYLDNLLRDMGRPTRRRGLRSLMQPLQPSDYAELLPRPSPVGESVPTEWRLSRRRLSSQAYDPL